MIATRKVNKKKKASHYDITKSYQPSFVSLRPRHGYKEVYEDQDTVGSTFLQTGPK